MTVQAQTIIKDLLVHVHDFGNAHGKTTYDKPGFFIQLHHVLTDKQTKNFIAFTNSFQRNERSWLIEIGFSSTPVEGRDGVNVHYFMKKNLDLKVFEEVEREEKERKEEVEREEKERKKKLTQQMAEELRGRPKNLDGSVSRLSGEFFIGDIVRRIYYRDYQTVSEYHRGFETMVKTNLDEINPHEIVLEKRAY